MIAPSVRSFLRPTRTFCAVARLSLARLAFLCAATVLATQLTTAQAPDSTPASPAATAPTPPQPPAADPASPPPQGSLQAAGPIAIVPVDTANATVTGAISVSEGKALIARSGMVSSGPKTTDVVLPRRGILRVCASTSVHLSSDASVPAGETPGLLMALDHGALEASFATGQNSDTVLTPDFRILIGAPGAAEVKIRLGQHGDTCVDNPGPNAPYVVVSSVFEGGAYRVQPGQRVMFQHGSLKEVVDQEKEPCGCPAEPRPGTNDFPLAQSAGLTPLDKPVPAAPAPAPNPDKPQQQLDQALVYTAPAAAEPPPQPAAAAPAAPAPPQTAPPAAQGKTPKKTGFFHSIGHFFRKVFGAE